MAKKEQSIQTPEFIRVLETFACNILSHVHAIPCYQIQILDNGNKQVLIRCLEQHPSKSDALVYSRYTVSEFELLYRINILNTVIGNYIYYHNSSKS